MARTIATLPTWTSGMRVTGTLLSSMVSYQQFWANAPAFQMYQTVTQSTTSGIDTQITMDASLHDSDAGRGGSTPWSYTIPSGYTGYWTFTVTVVWASNATGQRGAELRINGTMPASGGFVGIPAVSGNLTVVTLTKTTPVNAGDVVTAYGFQSSTAALSTATATDINSFFEGRLVSLGNP